MSLEQLLVSMGVTSFDPAVVDALRRVAQGVLGVQCTLG